MRSRMRKRCLVMATVPAALIMSAVPAGVAAAATQSHASAGGADHQYIVILHNQNTKLNARSAARRAAVAAEQKPVISQLRSAGGREVGSTSLVNAVVVKATASQAQALASNSAVAEVVPNQVIPGPTLPVVQAPGSRTPVKATLASNLCGTSATPELDPEALLKINGAVANPNADGAGITVATIADGLDPANPDFQRNAAYASAGSAAGSPMVTQVDFTGDTATTPTPGGEMFLDASSIAAQGNTPYDLSNYMYPGDPNPPPAGCDIKIVGDAPGASVLALKVFSENNDTTTSNFLQAINYAVANGAKVINESFGSNNFPDLAADVIRQADDAAVAAGVTVVASSGDAGITSTIGSPGTDSNVISVGASTTFRAYEQTTLGGVNVPGTNGKFVDNNISSLSSGGFSESGNTVDLVAPGDSNWALCSNNSTLYTDCTNFDGTGSSPIEFTGGTSESSPLVAGAAADVIQAYAGAHAGADPSPAQVKQILMSSATDINAPATQQGAGLLNIAAAVKLAKSAGTSQGGILISRSQFNIQQKTGATSGHSFSVTNTSSSKVTVKLSTRALTKQIANPSGTFCMQPGTPTKACPANTGVLTIWSGASEVYQKVHFTVPTTARPSRLNFSSDFQFTGQSSLMHVALIEPDGTYAGYSTSQGLADFDNIQVANPPAGKWTALFFTVKNSASATGTSGPIQWDANVSRFAVAGSVSPTSLTLAAGATGTAKLTVISPNTAGDTERSLVVSSGSTHTTVPITVRTTVPTTSSGGNFHGVLTGGNGRAGVQAQANYYTFTVPAGAQNIHAEINLANDPGDLLTGYLIDPSGQNLGYSTNVTLDGGGNPVSTKSVDLYHARPAPGTWTVALQWANPVSGLELQEPFTGTIRFGALPVTNNLPAGSSLTNGTTYTYKVTVKNSGHAPEAYFVDPRLNTTTSLTLPNQNSNVTRAASRCRSRPMSVAVRRSRITSCRPRPARSRRA